MKNIYLFLATVLTAGGIASAESVELLKTSPVTKQIINKNEGVRIERSRKLAAGITEQQVTLPNGLKMKTVTGVQTSGNVLNPFRKNAAKVGETPEGYLLYEDFEAWDGEDAAWLPEGWTIDHKDSPASGRGWKMTQPLSIYDYIDSKCLTYEMFNVEVDEWVITPEVTIRPGMELRWSTMTGPYFYNWDYLNSSTYQLDKYEIVNDIKVNISTDGGQTWTTLFSHAENLIETSSSFYDMFDYSVRPFSLSLDAYKRQKVMIGFQITGIDGNTTFLDNVSIGLPPTETSYRRPINTMYFGLSTTDEFVPASIMVGPVYSPVTYTNTTRTQNADFLWTYTGSYGQEQTSTDKNLRVTYTTDYTDDFTTRNNLYTFPVLEGSSATSSPDRFTYKGFYQAGGRAIYERHLIDTDEYEIINLGMTVADPINEGTATYADIILPYFGYNNESDRYWSNYSFGEIADENNWSHLEKIADFFYTPDVPLVIEGVHSVAYGKVSRNTKFTADIYLLDAGFKISETPYATAICTGNDIEITDRYSSSDLLALKFKFDEPIVISKDIAPYFIVAIGGFRDADNVQYFSPEMSDVSNPNNLGLGWIGTQMCWNGVEIPFSWSPVANHTNDQLVSFYIMLDGVLPWLEAETDKAQVTNTESATIALDSYYDGSELTVDNLPEWLNATVEGRYDKATVTFTCTDAVPQKASAVVTVKGPGVSKDIMIDASTSGVTDIITDAESGAAVIYTLEGRRVAADNLTPGLYIKREGQKTTKFIVK